MKPVNKSHAVSARKPGRPTQEAAVALRQSFLDASLDAFLEKGFAGASIHAIARKARISRDTFYRQFGSKEEVFRAATAHGLAAQQNHLRDIDYDAPPEQVLRQVLRRTLDDLTTPRSIAVLRLILAEAPRFPDVAAKMFADTREFIQPLPDYLGRLAREGIFDIDDPFEAAYALTTLGAGGVRFMLEPPPASEAERERYVDRSLKLFIKGWLRQPAQPKGKGSRQAR
jgi:AcrR family transcriptional regulator